MCEHGVERSDTGFTFIFLEQHTCMNVRVIKVWSLDVWCAGITKIIFLHSCNLNAHLIFLRHFMEERAKRVWVEGLFYWWVFRYLFKIILLHFIQQHASMWREYRNRWQQPNAYSNIINEMCEHGVERSDTGFTFIFLQQHTCMKVRVIRFDR